MKTFLKILGVFALSLYLIIAFISLMPNPSEWGTGGRGAFVFVTLLVSFVGTAIVES